jgi:hypothetical protein
MRLLKRGRPKPRPISEAVAYARCHGERDTDLVRLVPREAELVRLAPREVPIRSYRAAVSGETLRQAFELRLIHRAGR